MNTLLAALEAELETAAQNGDWADVATLSKTIGTRIAPSIADTVLAEIDSHYHTALYEIGNQAQIDRANTAAAMGAFLGQVGTSIDGSTLINEIQKFAQAFVFDYAAGVETLRNGSGIESILNHTIAANYAHVASSQLDQTLQTLDVSFLDYEDYNATDLKLVSNFLRLTAGHIDGSVLINEIQNFATQGNTAGVEAILSETAAKNYTLVTSAQLDQTLHTLDVNLHTYHGQNEIKAVGDFLSQTVTHIDGVALIDEIQYFAPLTTSGNYFVVADATAIETILSHTNTANYAHVSSAQLDLTLQGLDQSYYAVSDAPSLKFIGDFLNQTATHIDGATLATEISNFAQHNNLIGVETILAHTTAANYTSVDGAQLDQTLQAIDQNLYTDQNAHDMQVLANFLHQTGAHIDDSTLITEAQAFAAQHNAAGEQAIFSELINHLQADAVAGNNGGVSTLSTAIHDNGGLAYLTHDAADAIFNDIVGHLQGFSTYILPLITMRNFLGELGAAVDGAPLVNAMIKLENLGLGGGIEAILANTTAANYAHTSAVVLDAGLQAIDKALANDQKAGYSTNVTNDLKTLGDYLAQTSTHIDTKILASEVRNFAAAGVIAGEQAILAGSSTLVPHFQTKGGDGIDLSQLLTNTSAVQTHIDNFIHATTSNGNTVIAVNVLGTGKAADFVTAGTIQGVHDTDVAHLVAQHHLIV